MVDFVCNADMHVSQCIHTMVAEEILIRFDAVNDIVPSVAVTS